MIYMILPFPNSLLTKCQSLDEESMEQVGGTVLGAKLATERGWAINLRGGFHHCCGYEGGGFCAYADITLAIEFAFECLTITRF